MDKQTPVTRYLDYVTMHDETRVEKVREEGRAAGVMEALRGDRLRYVLPLSVVLCKKGTTEEVMLARAVDKHPSTALYWVSVDDTFGIYVTVMCETSPVTVKQICNKNVSADVASDVIMTLNGLMDLEPSVHVPWGYFIFRWRANWAANGDENSPIMRFCAGKGDTLKEAVRDLQATLGRGRELTFKSFSVAYPGTTGWVPLKVYGVDLVGEELHVSDINRANFRCA